MKCLVAGLPAPLLAMAMAVSGRGDPRRVAERVRLGADTHAN